MECVVKARLKKPWFRKPKMVFDVVQHYQHWYDPSYGNGGGDYRDAAHVVATYNTSEEAVLVKNTLNKYKGEKPHASS
jgi:hypothetical protein